MLFFVSVPWPTSNSNRPVVEESTEEEAEREEPTDLTGLDQTGNTQTGDGAQQSIGRGDNDGTLSAHRSQPHFLT